MANYIQPDVIQYQWMPLNLSDLFDEDSFPARLLALIRKMDLSDFDKNYANSSERGGRPALPVDRMLALIIWHLLHGGTSMRALARDLLVRADLMFLSGGLEIDHSTISVFHSRHQEAIKKLFSQTVFAGVMAGLIDLDQVSIDGTKIKASANKKDIGTKEELEARWKATQKACGKRYEQWKTTTDASEKQFLQEKIDKLEKQNVKLEAAIAFLEEHPEQERVHLTDKDADWKKDSDGGFIIGYNAQVAVDVTSQMIIHTDVVTDANDVLQTVPMVTEVENIAKQLFPDGDNPKEPIKFSLDCGYASEANLEALKDHEIYIPDRSKPNNDESINSSNNEPIQLPTLDFNYNSTQDQFTCPQGNVLQFKKASVIKGVNYREYRTTGCQDCELKSQCLTASQKNKKLWIQEKYLPTLEKVPVYPPGSKYRGASQGPFTQKMREKLNTPEGKEIYGKRSSSIETVFGIITDVRNGWQFLRRTTAKVSVEWIERCIAHNLGKLLNFQRV